MSTRGARCPNQDERVRGTTCSRRCHRWRQRKHCLQTLQEVHKKREQGQDEVKLMLIDVKKPHLNAKCKEEKWVELPDESKNFGRYAKLVKWLHGVRMAASGWKDDHAKGDL